MLMSSITAFFEALKAFFSLKEKKVEKQLETTAIKEYKNHKKSLEYAEKLVDLISKHGYFDTMANQDRCNRWIKKFRDYK